jgi:hypothetical protein
LEAALTSLLAQVIRLAYRQPALRKALLPLVLSTLDSKATMEKRLDAQVIPGGLGEDLRVKDVDSKQLAKGRKVEREHGGDRALQTEIALDHLEENPKYYKYLEEMEKKMEGGE